MRARVRAEMTDEIKQTARRHLAADGAPNLSLRAVARDLGMVSSALYRYFASRDELLTALIIDAYDALGEAAEQAEAAVDRGRPGRALPRSATPCGTGRWRSPHEYALIYGSPVPGYAAPQDTVGPATRVVVVLGAILADGVAAGVLRPRPVTGSDPGASRAGPCRADGHAPGMPPTVMARGMIAWTELFGAVNFEVFGRLENVSMTAGVVRPPGPGDGETCRTAPLGSPHGMAATQVPVGPSLTRPARRPGRTLRHQQDDRRLLLHVVPRAGQGVPGRLGRRQPAGVRGARRGSARRRWACSPTGTASRSAGAPPARARGTPGRCARRSLKARDPDEDDRVWLVPCFYVRRDARRRA